MALNESERYPFILMANRDEFLKRPALPMDWWEDHPHLLAGRDLEAGGTWLGLTKTGRVAVVTNVRDLRDIKKDARSRGDLVTDFLMTDVSAQAFEDDLQKRRHEYNGYNLLFGDIRGVNYASNKTDEAHRIDSGVHGLSNAALNTPWPKVNHGKNFLSDLIQQEADRLKPVELTTKLTGYMQREEIHSEDLPDTGIGEEWERKLSALYINAEEYGTRVTTVILGSADGGLFATEFNRRNDQKFEYGFEGLSNP
jgi:uncharacterized protein with NRDE domain